MSIESVLHESRIFSPSTSFSNAAHVGSMELIVRCAQRPMQIMKVFGQNWRANY